MCFADNKTDVCPVKLSDDKLFTATVNTQSMVMQFRKLYFVFEDKENQ